VVLTGFNTDIEHAGRVYHVQTEDKGSSNPYIESLVYSQGEILYSRRTPYHELIAKGIDPKTVANLMERQHRTIAEAIRRGMLNKLAGGVEIPDVDDATLASEPVEEPGEERTLDQVILDYLQAQKQRDHLVLRSSGDQEFLYGSKVSVHVTAVNSRTSDAVPDVRVEVLFKSTAEPRRLLLSEGVTDDAGSFVGEVELPQFNGGTSAVVITAQSELGTSEVKHLVHR
jgi:hypothetical protein